MNKIEFVDKFKDICSQLSLELEPYIEYGIKISNDTVNTDKVNISFKSEKITKEKLLDIVLSLFDKFDSVKEFIDNVYNEHGDKIKVIFIGSSNGSREIYFEMFESGEPSSCLSYDEKLDSVSNYLPLHDSKNVIDDLAKFIYDRTGLIIPEPYEYFKGGFVKNENIYYILVLEPLQSLKYVLSKLFETINPTQINDINEWLDNYSDYQLDNIAYSINNDKPIFNIYISKPNESGTN
jgi:peptide methionine sulfoxide reductase MsrA